LPGATIANHAHGVLTMDYRDSYPLRQPSRNATAQVRRASLIEDRYLVLLTAFLPALAILLAAGTIMSQLLAA
jgi:hypothetical protein